MENFSTPRQTRLPRIANLATLAVVVVATWWSGAQRPADSAAEAARQEPALITVQASFGPAPSVPELLITPPAEAVVAAPAAAQALWTSQSGPLRRDGLQAVGFGTIVHR